MKRPALIAICGTALLVLAQFLSLAWVQADEKEMLRPSFEAFMRKRPRYHDQPVVIYVDAKRVPWHTIVRPRPGSLHVLFRDAASLREAPGLDRDWIDPSTGRRYEFVSIQPGRLGVFEGTVHIRWAMGSLGVEVWTFKLWRLFGRWIVIGHEGYGVA